MFKLFIVTVWLEYQGKLWVKYALPLQSKCNVMTWWRVKDQYKNLPINIIAMKCTRVKDFKFDKRIYSYDKK